ncbi:MAG: segregation and condensation protein B [Parcubacteria group bacterium Gr01-1014_3]|nr:MAG: segregation and condensation protein B [Parcubacteria group bacterium Gr01-1014_3]
MPTNKQLSAKIEALLFIYGEAMTYKKMAETLDCSEVELKSAIQELEESIKSDQRGLILVSDKDKVQLTTKPDFAGLFEQLIKEEMSENLTPSALETLSIVTYAGPISRAEVDYIRGVNSSFTLRNLSIRGLVERLIDPHRANAYIYSPSMEFLKLLGISKKEDLPEHEKFSQLVKKLH